MKFLALDALPPVKQYLARIGAEMRSFKTAVVKEIRGSYWRDIAIIRFHEDGEVKAPENFAPTDDEAAAIKVEIRGFKFPKVQPLKKLIDPPPPIAKAPKHDLFFFHNLEGEIIMVQLRLERKGEKSYIPYTYWDDGEWRCMEPDGSLPLWGIDKLNDHTTVFIHEGAKAARAMREMVEAKTPKMKKKLGTHPWGEELASAAHIGWIGGALSPSRTDWSVIAEAGIKRAYIVSDNDPAGVSSVPEIAFQLRIPTFHVQFTNEWPGSFDLADEWPDHMFREIEGVQHYVGPSFRSCLHPATWATDSIEPKEGKGKPIIVLRENFKDMWAYCEEADLFICTELPEIIRSEQIMNNMLASFSHVNNVSKIILRAYRGRYAKLCYRPDEEGKMITESGTSAINLHIPTFIKPIAGDPTPFLKFMKYLFPREEEMVEALRWCATLIAQPATRMEYGLLLVSEAQGVGKTTLGASILAPLVGRHNTSYPSESAIVQSEFNEWMAHKRLVVVNEIYSGRSWKAYQKLKSVITDKHVEVNQKYQRQYVIENWCHILACSNSMRALRMEEDDRRWYYPEVTEMVWPRKKFADLYSWIGAGGLNIIKWWALEAFEHNYVKPGERAPMTERKKELIAGSRTEAQSEAVALAEAMNSHPTAIALSMKEIVSWVRQSVQGKVFDTDYELRKSMKEAGAIIYPKRLKVSGRVQHIILNRHEDWQGFVGKREELDAVRGALVSPSDILDGDM